MIIIRKGSRFDADGMARIYNHYVRTSPVIFSHIELDERTMSEKIDRLELNDKFPFLVAESYGTILGYAYAHSWQPDPVYSRSWELTMYLSDEASGKGLGSELIRRLILQCKERGAHTLVAFVTEGNLPCERMLHKAGFTLIGVFKEVGYKFCEYLNDALYQLIL